MQMKMISDEYHIFYTKFGQIKNFIWIKGCTLTVETVMMMMETDF